MARRNRHLNHAHLGAVLALDARFLGLASGSAVSTWADRGGSGRQVTKTGTARPTLVGDWVTFDGINDEMLGSDTGMPTNDFFISVLVKGANPPVGVNKGVVGYGTASAGKASLVFYEQTTNALGWSPYGAGGAFPSATLIRQLYQIRRSGTSCVHSLRGGTESSFTASGTFQLGGADRLSIGSFGTLIANGYLNGEIGAVSIFASVATAEVRRRILHSQAFSFKIPCS